MDEELSKRLNKAIAKIETFSLDYASLSGRIKKLEYDTERLDVQNQTMITQQGAVRIAIMNIKDSLKASLDGFRNSVATLASGFSVVQDDLQCTLGYTKQEIEKMTAQEYKHKILAPLGMAKSWQK